MTYEEYINFIDVQRRHLVAKGWDKSWANVTIRISENGDVVLEDATIHVLGSASDDTVYPEQRSCLWYPGNVEDDLTYQLSKAALVEDRQTDLTRKLYSALEAVKTLAEENNLSAEFVSPIEALAEKLRTNILEKK